MTDNRTTDRVDHSPRVREAIDELMREKDAIDNRTAELREKLREHDVEYEPTKFSSLQTTFTANGIEWIVTEREATGELFVEPRHGLTPEQAIAATLGGDNAFTREEVESAFVRGYSLGSLPVGSDPQWDENRRTVDEHMAELGWVRAATLVSGTCEVESKIFIEGEYVPCQYYEYEMECGGKFRWDDPEPPKCCPNCGAKAIGG